MNELTSLSAMQMIFLDLLFLGLAGALALWFRAVIRNQQRALDQQLVRLEAQQGKLDSLGKKLQGVTNTLERLYPPPTVPSRHESSPDSRMGLVEPELRSRRTPRPTSATTAAQPRQAQQSTGPERGQRRQHESPRGAEAYALARELLDRGLPSSEVARRVGLGVAEIDVLKRMRQLSR